MALEELQFKADELAFKLEAQNRLHAETVMKMKEEAKHLRRRLQNALEKDAMREKSVQVQNDAEADNTFVRRLEWRLDDFSNRLKSTPKNTAIWSDEFSILGVSPMQLEFFPQGRDTTALDGFCALFLWCRGGVKIKYQLRVGNHWSAPDEDEYKSRMGHGHSTFCYLEAQQDTSTDSVLIGIDILSLSVLGDPMMGLQLENRGPEAVVAGQVAVLHNRHMQCVEWKIKNILQRIKDVPRGLAICSPLFSIAGVREMLLEFYPNGIQPSQPAKDMREGFCGFYVRCPSGNSIVITLYVGKANKGPIKTDFDGNAAKGLPEFCKLADQIPEGEESPDLIVGIRVENPQLEAAGQETTLYLENN